MRRPFSARHPARLLLRAALLIPLLLGVSGAKAADPTAEHRAVYAEVNDSLGSMRKTTFTLDLADAPVPVEGTAWRQAGQVRKIRLVFPGDHGDSLQEYYYTPGADLLFVYEAVTTQSINGGSATLQEHRHYFQDGRMFRWLAPDRQPVTTKSADFRQRELDLLDLSSLALEAVDRTTARPTGNTGGKTGGSPPNAGAARETTGIFTGIESGDYSYLLLKTGTEEQSYMILQTDDALDRLLADPDRYIGKRITVVWQTAREDIPEAGGRVEVTKALSVRLK